VYRISGTAVAHGERTPWSLVLKALAPPADGSLPREVFLYQSGFLASLAGGLVAPRCFAIAELPSGALGLWLEHLTDAVGPAWPVERFARAAFHLGEFSGAYTRGGELPPWPWLHRVDPSAIAGDAEKRVDLIARLSETAAHPLVRRAFPPAVLEGLYRLWAARRPLLDALAQVPSVVCRGDAQRRNLFARRDPDGRERTVAIDWANLHAGHVATDIATLVHQAFVYFDADIASAAHLDRAVFDAYIDGLNAGGWMGNPRAVRLAYAVRIVFGHGLSEMGPLLRVALDERRHGWAEQVYGKPLGQIFDRRAALARFLLQLADEALILVGRNGAVTAAV
jgi:hypothetical protein